MYLSVNLTREVAVQFPKEKCCLFKVVILYPYSGKLNADFKSQGYWERNGSILPVLLKAQMTTQWVRSILLGTAITKFTNNTLMSLFLFYNILFLFIFLAKVNAFMVGGLGG